MTVAAAVKEYLEWKIKYHPQAGKSYKPFIKKFATHFRGKNLEDLNMRNVMSFITGMSERYASASVWFMVAILHTFFKYYPNIIDPYHIQYPRLTNKEIRFLTEEEFKLIDDQLDEWKYPSVRNKLIHHMFWNTGIRVGELCAIGLDDIDMATRSAKILTEKSKKVAYITWDERTHQLLINYLGVRLQNGGDTLFIVTAREVQRIIRCISTTVNLQGITPHKYRHGKAHAMLKQGASVDDIAFVLRHENSSMTKKMYLRLNREENLVIQQKYLVNKG